MSQNTAPSHKEQEQDLYDITTAAAAAEAEILERSANDVARAKTEAGTEPETKAKPAAGQTCSHASYHPPVDVFATPSNWTLQFAVPGAKEGDVSVSWDGGRSSVVVKGNVSRPGEGKVVLSETRVGEFERAVTVPPVEGDGDKGEVDGKRMVSRLEEGVLIVTVPRRRG